MSTKTTFKRLALVTVAALGLGVLSVVPSNAVVNADSLTVSSATASQTTAETSTATNPTTTLSFLSGAQNDSYTITASLVSGPTTGTALPYLELVETASASIDTLTATLSASRAVGFKVNPNDRVTAYNTTATGTNARVSAKFKVYLGQDSRTAPTVAGTYVVRVTPALGVGTAGTLIATAQTITFTVTAAPANDTAASAALSTVFIAAGETRTATADATILGSKTASSTAGVASIVVTQRNAANTTSADESMTATITGAGTLGAGPVGNQTSATVSSTTSVGRSIIVKNGDIIKVFPDGTAGVGTITISTITGTLLGTKSVTFFGDVAAIVTAVRTTTLGTGANSSAIRATAYDASGNLVSGASLYATSDATSVVSSSYLLGTGNSGSDIGTYDFNLTGVAKGTAKITVGVATSATDVTTTGYAIKADPVTVTVGGGAADLADVLVSLDKASYAPGSRAMITVTPVDKLGKPLAPGTYTVFDQAAKSYTAGFVFSDSVTSLTTGLTDMVALPTTSVTTRTSNSTVSSAVPVLIAPNTAGYWIQLPNLESDFTITYKTAASFPGNPLNAGLTRTITVPLTLPGTQAAVDAAAEATDAANAATDAALAAADAADAATAAAEDASAAVAKLSKSVTTALNNLKKQITSLTALVNKLLKR